MNDLTIKRVVSGNIYRHEFRMLLRSAIIWSLSMALLILVFVSLFSSIAEEAELLNQLMSDFPEELLMAFGMSDIDFSTVLGYFGFAFLFVQICLAIQAANYGFGLVSIEERELTADFLLAKPVGRTQILTSKLLAALSGLTITNGIVWVSTFGFIEAFRGGRSYAATPLMVLLASIVLFQLFFLSLGIVISLLVKRVRNVTPYAMGLGFGMYVLNVFGDMLGENVLEKVTPFRHFEPHYILSHAAWDLSLVLISVAVILVSLVVSYVLYNRRDIAAAV